MPRFVILEHRWNGVHWDVMLEVGDVLKTWAVDAPIRPGVDLPARRLADHRPAYLDYQGEVSGGRGSVARVDRGEYRAVVWAERSVQVDLRGSLHLGRARFERIDGQSDVGGANWRFRFDEGNVD